MWKCPILLAILMGCAFAEQPSSGPLAQGIELLQKGDFQHSLILLRHAVELKPGSAPAHNYYGFALARNGSVDQAVQEFQKALKLDPRYPDALYNLGTALAVQEKYPAAVENLERRPCAQARISRS